MLFKMSLRNARRQAQEYLIYFITIVMVAALIYAFNGLIFSKEIQDLSNMISSLSVVIVLSSIVVVCIIGWLVSYTTNFMLSCRSREFGTYILIGMENRQVALLFFLENLAVGSLAFILGILLGNLFFQVLRAIVLALFGVRYTFSFTFSLKAIGLTLFFFVLIYFFSQVRSHRRIRSMKIYDLIYLDRQNEGVVIQTSKKRKKIFIVSIGFGVVGTIFILLGDLLLGLLGAGCIIIFLYGFFLSFASGVPEFFHKRPAKKYQGQTLLIFRTLTAKLATMGVLMATISLLFTATFISEGTGQIFRIILQNRAKRTTCFDLMISIDTHAAFDQMNDYLTYMEEEIPIETAWRYFVYLNKSASVLEYLVKSDIEYYPCYKQDTLMKASDYAMLRSMLGYSNVTIEPGTFLIHCESYLAKTLGDYTLPITVGKDILLPGSIYTESFSQFLWNVNGTSYILVVPDEVIADCQVHHYTYAAVTTEPVSEKQAAGLLDIQYGKERSNTIYVKSQVEAEAASSTTLFVFPLYYLAFVLAMTAAAILTIQQLSEIKHYRRQFLLLQKLGMDWREMNHVLRNQFMLYYAMPAIPPMLIGIPFILNLCYLTDPGTMVESNSPFIVVGISVGLFIFIYLVYSLTAYTSLKRNVLPILE